MAVFDWMEPARAEVNDSTDFRKLGSTNVKLAFKSGKHCNLVEFHGFQIGEIRPIDPDIPFAEAEIMIDMPTRSWNVYRRKRALGRIQTLLSMDVDKSLITASNPLNRRLFDRFHKSIQMFVDAGANWNAHRANV